MVFKLNFVVLRILDYGKSYEMLLGRPYFILAKVSQNWGSGLVTLRKGKKRVQFPMVAIWILDHKTKLLCALAINLAHEVGDDEEEAYLQANPYIVTVFEVDVAQILEKYKKSLYDKGGIGG